MITVYFIKYTHNPYFYIGSTFDFKVRKSQHLRDLKASRHCNKNLSELGTDGIVISPYKVFYSLESARECEKYLVQNCESKFLLNTWIYSFTDRWSLYSETSYEEAIKEASASTKKVWQEKGFSYMSERIKEGLKNEPLDKKEDRLNKLIEARRNKIPSKESCRKMSEAQKLFRKGKSKEELSEIYRNKEYTWDGEIHSNFRKLAKSLGVSDDCLRRYYKKGIRDTRTFIESVKRPPRCELSLSVTTISKESKQ